MTKKHTKSALFTSVMALILCCAMLVGTTLAWFTDQVDSGMNNIKAGNLDVELMYEEDGSYKSVRDVATLFNDVKLWEPGAVAYENLKVSNEGNLSLIYQMALNFTNATKTETGKTLADVLKVAIKEGGFNGDREAAKALNYDYNLSTFALEGELEAGAESEVYGVVIYWEPTNNDNAFNMNNGKETVLSIELGINLFATQMEYEKDSFDNTYDKDAALEMPEVVTNAADTASFLQALREGNKVVLTDNLVLNEDAVIPVGVTSAIDFNDFALTTGENAGIEIEGNLILTGNSATVTDDVAGAAYVGYTVGDTGTLQIDGAKIDVASGSIGIDVQGSGTLIMNSGEINVAAGGHGIFMMQADGANINLNGGKVSGEGDGIYMCLSEADVYAAEGTMDAKISVLSSSTLNLTYAGDTQPTVAPDNTNNTINIQKATAYKGITQNPSNAKQYYINSKAGLKNMNALLGSVSPNEANIITVDLMTDVNLSGESWSPINSMWVTFNGNNHTISNINAGTDGRRSGFWGYAGAVTINDLTLENVTVSGSQAGTFAGAAEGLKTNNCYLKGTNVVNFVAGVETWNGIGAITGVLTDSTVNVEIVSGATVTLNKGSMTTDPGCTYVDDKTGYIQDNKGSVINNGTIIVNEIVEISSGLSQNKGTTTYYVSNADGLATLNAKMADKSLGRDAVINLTSDIDFTGKTWTPVDSHADTAFTMKEINGNGHTISNMTINGQAMFTRFAGSGDVTVKDITFDNVAVNSTAINTSILTVQSYQNVLLDNVDVKNSTITGSYKVAPLIATVYNESSSTVTATLKNCDVENVIVKATSYDFCTAGMVAFVYADDNDKIEFENCTVANVKLMAPTDSYAAHAAVYTTGSSSLFNEAEGVTVTNVTFEALS